MKAQATMACTHLLLNFSSLTWRVIVAQLWLVTLVCTGAFKLAACWDCSCLLVHLSSADDALAVSKGALARALQGVSLGLADSLPECSSGW